MRVAQCRTQESALELHLVVLDVDPVDERVDVRPKMLVAQRLDLGRRAMTPRSIELEDPADAREAFARDHILDGDRGLPHLGSAMRPTTVGIKIVVA